MAELALTGFINPARADYARPASSRSEQTAAPSRPANRQAHVEREPEAAENERIVTGEVIDADDNTYQNINARQTRTAASDSPNTTNPQTRRFSMQAAVQTFRDNESMVTHSNQSRQVSGIIDEYV